MSFSHQFFPGKVEFNKNVITIFDINFTIVIFYKISINTWNTFL